MDKVRNFVLHLHLQMIAGLMVYVYIIYIEIIIEHYIYIYKTNTSK